MIKKYKISLTLEQLELINDSLSRRIEQINQAVKPIAFLGETEETPGYMVLEREKLRKIWRTIFIKKRKARTPGVKK